MNRKFVLTTLFILSLALALWYFREPLFAQLPVSLRQKIQKDIDDEAFLPPPLRRASHGVTGILTSAGTVNETNRHRAANGLAPLQSNDQLVAAAERKIDDMFQQQYFAHRSPEGKGPSDLANGVHYAYLIVGENLALGDFRDDADLVQAWMDSPGHRANILNNKYSQIGVAARVGNFEGEPVWLAVQEFGLPDSACPSADEATGALIDVNKKRLVVLESDIAARKAELDRLPPQDPSYNTKAAAYNKMVAEYNDLVERTKRLAVTYNEAVEKHNACLKKAGQ